MIILNHPQGSDDWLRARVGVCTASRFSDAIGVLSKASKNGAAGDPNGDAIKYAWLIAMETIAREPLDETFVTYAMRRGQELEPMARSVYEKRTGAWIEEVSLILTDDSRFGYSADGFRDDDGLIEIKCPLACDKLGQVWQSPEAAHLEYIDQINGGLWITGRKYCDLIVYCPWLAPVGKDLFVKRIHRDEAAIEALEAGLLRFMRMADGFLEILRTPAKMSGNPKDAPAAAAPAADPFKPMVDPGTVQAKGPSPRPSASPSSHPQPSEDTMNDTAELTFRDVAPVEIPTLSLSQITDRLGFVVTAKLLEGLGFTAHAVKASRLYRPSEFPAICDELIKHIKAARDA